MADIHILTGTSKDSWNVVLHIPVPNGTNHVGVNWRTALLESGLGGTTRLTEGTEKWEITTAEKAQVEAGEVYEHPAQFRVEANGLPDANIRLQLQEWYATAKDQVITKLQSQLKYFGHTESEN